MQGNEQKKCKLGCVLTLSMMMSTFVWVIPMKVHLMSSELKVIEKRYYMYISVMWWWGRGDGGGGGRGTGYKLQMLTEK